jgi:hypothetical protein
MGMDVYGKEPTAEVGEYFRRNVWGWHPLWEMCEDLFPTIAGQVECAHTNDGDGLDADLSVELAKGLTEAVADGRVKAWIDERNAHVAALPMVPCRCCDATGIRTDEIGLAAGWHDKALSKEDAIILGREFGSCNACHGHGESPSWLASYETRIEDATEFSEFLAACGGFEIC